MSAPVPVPVAEKIAELERELAARHRAFPRWIAKGTIKPATATRRIQIINAILADYREKVASQPDFFKGEL